MNAYTIKDIQRKLRGKAPQHTLIHLCEKKVIVPKQGANGRGSNRRFSNLDLVEFAIALELKKFGVKISSLEKIMQIFRTGYTASQSPMSTYDPTSPKLLHYGTKFFLVIVGGNRVYILEKTGKKYSGMMMHFFDDTYGIPKEISGLALEDLSICDSSYLLVDLSDLIAKTLN